VAQVGRLGLKVGSHMALLCIHRVNRVNARMTVGHDDSTINIVLDIIKAQYTPPTPTRLRCRVESRRRSSAVVTQFAVSYSVGDK